MKIKVIADDKIPFLRGVLEPFCDVTYLPGQVISAKDVRNADALLTRTRTACNATLLEGSKVRFIATATIGFDHIDTAYCREHGIFWTSAPGCNSGSVRQYVISALVNLAAGHHLKLAGKTLGVIGVGQVGEKIVQAAEVLGMRVLKNDPPRQRKEGAEDFVSISRILAEADFITLHVPLNRDGIDRTWHLADHDFLRQMRPGSFLINSSRGEVVDNAALKEVLAAGLLGGAVLDVWENEPDIDRELLESVNFGTPHIAGYSADGKANGTAMCVNALSRFFSLELNNWQVPEIPTPEPPLICSIQDVTVDEEVRHAVNAAYDISFDDQNLRNTPQDFEKQRGDYYLRREFPAFTITDCSPQAAVILKKLGFACR